MEAISYALPTGKDINIFDDDKKYSHQMSSDTSLRDMLDYYQLAVEQDDLEAIEKEIHRHCLIISINNGCDSKVAEDIEAYLLDQFVNTHDMQLQ